MPDTSMTPALEKQAIRAEIFDPKLPLMSVLDDSALEDDGSLVRYLDRSTDAGRNSSVLGERPAEDAGVLALGRLKAGYGRIFRDSSRVFNGRNGTAREEPGCLYVKASFRF